MNNPENTKSFCFECDADITEMSYTRCSNPFGHVVDFNQDMRDLFSNKVYLENCFKQRVYNV